MPLMDVHRITAELEIRNMIARLAQLADSGELDEYLSLLTDDVVWVMPASPHVGLAASERRGHDEIAAGAEARVADGLQGPGTDTMHTVTTTSIRVESDDVALARSSFVFWIAISTAPEAKSIGRYDDTFARTSEGWKLARRSITFG